MTFFQQQQKLMSASGLLIRDESGSVILVKPRYKETWQLPGGFLEDNESPRQAAEREVLEELGVYVACESLLCVDFKSANGQRPACLQFVFSGGIVSAATLEALTVDGEEIETWAAVPANEAHGWAEPGGPASRMKHSVEALQRGTVVYLEDGEPSGKFGKGLDPLA